MLFLSLKNYFFYVTLTSQVYEALGIQEVQDPLISKKCAINNLSKTKNAYKFGEGLIDYIIYV